MSCVSTNRQEKHAVCINKELLRSRCRSADSIQHIISKYKPSLCLKWGDALFMKRPTDVSDRRRLMNKHQWTKALFP